MQVLVNQVVPDGTVGIGRGTDLDTGNVVLFAGDWRPMAAIAEALQTEPEVVADVPDWAVINRLEV